MKPLLLLVLVAAPAFGQITPGTNGPIIPAGPITFTNRNGEVVSNVQVTRLATNGFYYDFTDGTTGAGFVNFTNAPAWLQKQLKYDPVAAAALESKKRAYAEKQTGNQAAQTTYLVEQRRRIAIRNNLKARAYKPYSTVIQKVSAGLLVDSSGGETLLVVGHSGYGTAVEGTMLKDTLYPMGTFQYTTVAGSSKTVRRVTPSEDTAFEYFLNPANEREGLDLKIIPK